jgi:hypothetical protein
MNHLSLRNSMLMLAPALLLCACGKSTTDPAQGAATIQQGSTPAPVAQPAPDAVASPDATQPGATAVREFRDPVTGQPREPTAAELKASAASQSTSKAGTGTRPKDKEIVFPNGTVAVEEATMSEMKGCVQKDGRTVVDHDCKANATAPVAKP